MWLVDPNPFPILLTCSHFLPLASKTSLPGKQGLSPRNKHILCVKELLSLFSRLFRGQIPPRQDPFSLPWCGCEKGVAEHCSSRAGQHALCFWNNAAFFWLEQTLYPAILSLAVLQSSQLPWSRKVDWVSHLINHSSGLCPTQGVSAE